MKYTHIKWNILKNAILIVTLALSYPLIKNEFAKIENIQTLNTLLLFVGLIIVAPLFANFQFSYQFSKSERDLNILLSHATTFLSMLVIGLLAIMIDVIFVRLVGNLLTFRITLLLFLICMLMWDFWDFLRLERNVSNKKP